eukprot:6877524-Ditylum_brightwellii.AAC.1
MHRKGTLVTSDNTKVTNALFSLTWNAFTGNTGVEPLTGDTTDISEWEGFDIWDWELYWDAPHKEENPMHGQWLGVSHHVGGANICWVIGSTCQVISRTTVHHVTRSELKTDEIRQKFTDLVKKIYDCLDNTNFVQH